MDYHPSLHPFDHMQTMFVQTCQPDPVEIQRQLEARRRTQARKRAKEHFRPRTPEPLEGRKHMNVQTGIGCFLKSGYSKTDKWHEGERQGLVFL